jgi:poly(A) polymerase
LAYRVGLACAADRLLMSGALDDDQAATAVRHLAGWQRPKLPVSGGMLIARGLEAGPAVARTLQAIERDWIEAGFPEGDAFETILDKRLAQALRDSQ